ncbi:YdcF family protein, partial [Pseudomonas aeruginosa]
MPIRYFFKQLLLPPGGLLLLLFFAFWWRTSRPRLARLCGVCGFFGLWLMSMPLSVEWMARWLESELALLAEDLPVLARRADDSVLLCSGRRTNTPAGGDDAP